MGYQVYYSYFQPVIGFAEHKEEEVRGRGRRFPQLLFLFSFLDDGTQGHWEEDRVGDLVVFQKSCCVLRREPYVNSVSRVLHKYFTVLNY